MRAAVESTTEIISLMSSTFYFLCQPRNIPTLMQVNYFVVQELFYCELNFSFLHRLQLQAIRNFVSKWSFQNFSNRFVITTNNNNQSESRNLQPAPGLLINSVGNEVGSALYKLHEYKERVYSIRGCEVCGEGMQCQGYKQLVENATRTATDKKTLLDHLAEDFT